MVVKHLVWVNLNLGTTKINFAYWLSGFSLAFSGSSLHLISFIRPLPQSQRNFLFVYSSTYAEREEDDITFRMHA